MPYAALADAVLALHVAVVLFVVGGLAAIVAGNTVVCWPAVDRPAFRGSHLAAIGTVVAESWAGFACPLTTLEQWLRVQGGQAVNAQGFIARGLQAVLYHDLPPAVFTAAYTVFGMAVVAAWWRWPPRRGDNGCLAAAAERPAR